MENYDGEFYINILLAFTRFPCGSGVTIKNYLNNVDKKESYKKLVNQLKILIYTIQSELEIILRFLEKVGVFLELYFSH